MKNATFKDVNGFEIAFDDVLYSVGNKVCRKKVAFLGAAYTVDNSTAFRVAAYIRGENIAAEAGDDRAEYTGTSCMTRFMLASLRDAKYSTNGPAMRATALRTAYNIAAEMIAGTLGAYPSDDIGFKRRFA